MRMKFGIETVGLFLVLTVLEHIEHSLACSCAEAHPQTSYCKADFVVKAKVKSEQQLYGMRRVKRNGLEEKLMYSTYKRYRIRISRIFKDSPAYMNVTKHYVYTSSMDSTCGVTLKNNTKYLLQGWIVGGKPLISICDRSIEWHQLSVRQRKGYSYLYENYCACKIELCYTPKCQKKVATPGICRWNKDEDPGMCYSQHSMCVDKGAAGCVWSRTNLLKQCINTVKQDGRLEP